MQTYTSTVLKRIFIGDNFHKPGLKSHNLFNHETHGLVDNISFWTGYKYNCMIFLTATKGKKYNAKNLI